MSSDTALGPNQPTCGENAFPASFRRPLRVAKWCFAIPFALGVGSLAVWLLSGGRLEDLKASHFFTGMFAIGLGVVLLPIGLIATVLAGRRGASRKAVAIHLMLLLANFPAAALCWAIGGAIADLQIVRISNSSGAVIGPLRVWTEPELNPRHAIEIAQLQPGETRTWVLRYSNEGCATFRCVQGEKTIEAKKDEGVFLGVGQPMEVQIEIGDNGSYTINGQFARRWSWLAALKSSTQ